MPHPGGCPARLPTLDGPGHWCEYPAGHDGHHDLIEWAGPWMRWCDYPLTCDRLDCDLSAASASNADRIERAARSGYMQAAHLRGEHDGKTAPMCPGCGTYWTEDDDD